MTGVDPPGQPTWPPPPPPTPPAQPSTSPVPAPPPTWPPPPPPTWLPPPPPPGRGARRITLAAILAIAVAVAAVAAGLAIVIVTQGHGPPHPDEWDERVVALVEWVEETRGLSFVEPVYVDFLTPSEYSEFMTVGTEELTDEELEDMVETVSMLRALGLVSGDFQLLDAMNTLSDTGTLAFYDVDEERIRVRGTEIDVGLQVTLVHELVHVLQDQHFDLSRMQQTETSGELSAFRAVVEGDATVVEQIYIDSLSEDELDEYLRATVEQDPGDAFDEVPSVLQAMWASPYALGGPLVQLALVQGGARAVNELLDDPPTTELDLLEPWNAFSDIEPAEVSPPEDRAGDEVLDEGDFGAISLYLVLASRIDPLEALEAAVGWRGDYYTFTRSADGTHCLNLALLGGSEGAARKVEEALLAWAGLGPSAADASIERDGAELLLRSCDPGTEVDHTEATDGLTALSIAATRSQLIASFADGDLDRVESICAADAVIAELPREVLTAVEVDRETAALIRDSMERASTSCAT